MSNFNSGTGFKATNEVVYRLDHDASKDWWQLTNQTKVFRWQKRKPTKYENQALLMPLMFFAVLPFPIIMVYHNHGAAAVNLIFLTLCFAAALFVHLILAYRQHCKIIKEVRLNDIGLRLKSPFLKERSVTWSEIADFFEIQTGDYVLLTTKGEDFVLSSGLSNSEALFERIHANCPAPNKEFSVNTRLPIAYIDSAIAACISVSGACLFVFFQNLLYFRAASIELIILIAIVVPTAICISKLHTSRLAEVVRIGETAVWLKMRSGAVRQFRREEIRKVNRLGGYFLLSTDQGKFFAIIEANEPAFMRITEFGKTAISLKS